MANAPTLPLLIEPDQLQPHLTDRGVLVVDLCDPASYAAGHIPGAVHLDYADLVRVKPPTMGLLPTEARLGEVLSRLGLTAGQCVVAYDEEGNGRAGRLLWTLAVLGYERLAMLNGGIHAWDAAGGRLENRIRRPAPSFFQAQFRNLSAVADKDYILARLGQPGVALLDTRSPAEYAGLDQTRGPERPPSWCGQSALDRHHGPTAAVAPATKARIADPAGGTRRDPGQGGHRLLPDSSSFGA